ncbi:hypothetical protein C1637_15265 [Chryseobacterium lactis]|uniref:Gingipain domain-containing protein n=1 Tax=Chryseobacterium lactis TaxID=1241981 RepID=A0A3G6RFU1_CHRLC|nr:hypothetical protein [Chryseobacterium lactis]AZA83528.1 hypothetical protein EG342_17300 [Chryseobacterium lactis]AZB03912.1 hypothetical protein EG341_08175 [Chryseobacterium lactis]PNW13178.1 hypothetical protein C1637_15265 [Chryseobacterium lactis]
MGGTIAGLSYTGKLFDNRATSTEMAAAKYIISPDYNDGDNRVYNLNPEEPVSFFGEGDDPVFHNVYKQMYDLFKNTKGDGIFRVYGHGNFETLFNGEERIRDAKTFDTVMSFKNQNWKNVDKMKDPILILYACLSGTDNKGVFVPMGKQISEAHPKLTVFAFNGFVTYNANVSGIQNSNLRQNSNDGNGIIKIYYGGKAISAYHYKEFLKYYPGFK